MAKPETIVKVVTLLGETFGRQVTAGTIEVYRIGLVDLTDDEVTRAAGVAVTRCRFMPVPAELREFAGVTTEADRALLAWSAVERTLSRGPYKHLDFDDGAINATIRNLGGWPTFLSRFTDAEAEKWARKEFIETYEVMARAAGEEECAPLAGLAEADVVGSKIVPPRIERIESRTGRIDPPRLASSKREPAAYIRGGEIKRIGQIGR